MKSKILVDYESYMCSVALLEDGVLREFYVEGQNMNRITGNIYKGRVVNVLPGLQSAFVDIGLRKNGFLAAEDMLEDRTALARSGAVPTRLDAKEGDYVLVQAIKEPSDTKGPRLSANLSIPGRYVVYMPTIDFIGVSNKITDNATREKLFNILTKNRPDPHCGLIARTAAKDARKSDIIEEIEYFANTYISLLDKFRSAGGVSLLSTDGNLVFRTVRDILNSTVDEIVCSDTSIANRLNDYLRENLAQPVKVTLMDDVDVLKKFGVLSEVEKLLRHKVELKNGGSIVIDYTEALTVIDVNTAKFTGDTDHERTVYEINCEAAREIARQLRLRNIGGMIVIDFIDMQDPLHNEDVVNILIEETQKDRTRTRVLPMTELGLVQMTRKKTGSEIQSLLLTQCERCHGTARTQSPGFMARKIKAQLVEIFADPMCTAAVVSVNPDVFDKLSKGDWFKRFTTGKYAGKLVYLVSSSEVGANSFRIGAQSASILSLPDSAFLVS
ncbi:MAG: Rne/Rng family ribonuclease [Clostridiales bacterium]|nr:Rne/Rng family ribonuclease [Clostridiales bacterium]